MTKKEAREYAALLYMKNEGLSLQDIALKVGVHPNTITKWKREDDWDGLASVLLTTRHEQLKRLYQMLKAKNDEIMGRKEGTRFPTKADADVLSQVTKSIQNLEQDMGVGTIIDVFIRFISYVGKVDGKMAKKIVEYQDAFVKAQMT
jgi:transposase